MTLLSDIILKLNEMINREIITQKAFEILRWFVSIAFFFLALTKVISLIESGLTPYKIFLKAAVLPEYLKYYGVQAVLIEFFLAVGLWVKQIYIPAIAFTIGLTFLGVMLSIYSLILKLNSDCGCGLLGDNEYAILTQKLFIIGALIILLKGKGRLFV